VDKKKELVRGVNRYNDGDHVLDYRWG